MTGRDDIPARLRGGFIGALCGATTLAAHGIAGGSVPDPASLAVLILAGGAVGLMARIGRRRPVARLASLLLGGQAIGHLLLVASSHQHGALLTAPMLAAHALAALLGAALVVVAEHVSRQLLSAPGWIVLLVTGVRPAPAAVTLSSSPHHADLAVRLGAAGPAPARGPPVFATA